MQRIFRQVVGIYLCGVALLLSGCVTMEAERDISVAPVEQEPVRKGVYHKVKRGETLWRIAKTYGISVGEITAANKIPKAAKIEKGQLLFVPGASKTLDIVLDTDQNENEFAWPVDGKVIKYFHERYGNKLHKGIDIKAKVGDDIKASRTGRVVFADYLTGYGYTVILDHEDGYHSVYANNSKLFVRLGEMVIKKSPLARIGHNRNIASAHFQIRKKSVENNPLHYLP